MKPKLLHDLLQTVPFNTVICLARHLPTVAFLFLADVAHQLVCHQYIIGDEAFSHERTLVLTYNFLQDQFHFIRHSF